MSSFPTLADHPAASAAKADAEQKQAALSAIVQRRLKAEQGLNVPSHLQGERLRQHLDREGIPTDKGNEVVTIRREEWIANQATLEAVDRLQTINAAAMVELSVKVKIDVFDPAAKAAALLLLNAVAAIAGNRKLYDEIKVHGFSVGAFPFSRDINIDPQNPSGYTTPIRALVKAGILSAADVEAVFPGLTQF